MAARRPAKSQPHRPVATAVSEPRTGGVQNATDHSGCPETEASSRARAAMPKCAYSPMPLAPASQQ
jgi:hypothetical protein